jgi:hypothetical protein
VIKGTAMKIELKLEPTAESLKRAIRYIRSFGLTPVVAPDRRTILGVYDLHAQEGSVGSEHSPSEQKDSTSSASTGQEQARGEEG